MFFGREITILYPCFVLTCKQSERVHHGGSLPPRSDCLVGVEQGDSHRDHTEHNRDEVEGKGCVNPAERNG